MHQDEQAPARLRWARLRFSIIGQLLASPPESGDLASRIDELENGVAERDRLLNQRDAEAQALHQTMADAKDQHDAAEQ